LKLVFPSYASIDEQKLRNPGERSSTLSFGGGFVKQKYLGRSVFFSFFFGRAKKEKKEEN
jgi:hypothetical protein